MLTAEQVLISPVRQQPARELVLTAWREAGGKVIRLPSAWTEMLVDQGQKVYCYGGVAFCTEVARRLHLKLVEPALDLLSQIDVCWVRRRIVVRSLASLERVDFPAFIKSLDYDLFPSAVYNSKNSFRQTCGTLDSETLVLVSTIVKFVVEARALFCDGHVVSVVPYYQSVRLPTGAKEFASQLAKGMSLPRTCVVDIGMIAAGHWVIVEFNPVWASNTLGADLRIFLSCLTRSCGLDNCLEVPCYGG